MENKYKKEWHYTPFQNGNKTLMIDGPPLKLYPYTKIINASEWVHLFETKSGVLISFKLHVTFTGYIIG